ncbi:MAG: response regulator [Candidatus Thorarchaeota archaeon]|nr:response regulator [Candidatus Thorarchaeota archaeon]
MKIRVLVIDDDEDLLFLAQKFLTKEDDRFELVSANTDQEALQILEEEEFDAIVCDHYLGPHSMTGLDLLEWVREGHPQIPFIILTGRSQEAVAIRALNLGADYYLKKGTEDFKELFSQIAHRIKTEVESRRTEEALENAYAELEHRVAERTAELQEINAKLLHEIKEREKIEISLLLQRELGNTLCRTGNLTEALDKILKTAVQLEGIDSGGIYQLDNSTGQFDLSSNQGISTHFLHSYLKLSGKQIIDRPVFLTKSEICALTTISELNEDTNAAAILPVFFEEEVVAILCLVSHDYDEIPLMDKQALEAISIQIGAYMARVKAETSYNESQSELMNIFDSLDELFLLTDKSARIVGVNDTFLSSLGYSSKTITKKNLQDIYKFEHLGDLSEIIQKVMEGEVLQVKHQALTRKGKSIHLLTHILRAELPGRELLYFISSKPESQ